MEGTSLGHFSVLYLILAGQSLNPDDDLTSFIHDALRFISAFFVPISHSAPHLYLSALPFAPDQSRVARQFRSRFPNTFVVTQGKPSQWPTVVFTENHLKDPVYDMAFSLNESTFLYRSLDTVCICDSKTGHCISSPFKVPEGAKRALFSPSGKHILFKYESYAILWDIERGKEQLRTKGYDFVFVHRDGRIVSARLLDEDQDAIRILVQFWDASNGALILRRLLEVSDVGHSRFSPDGHFLAIVKKYENVIELRNLEDSKDIRQFTYPGAKLSFLHFSPTSDTLMAVFEGEPRQVCLWRLDTQEMASFNHGFDDAHIIHSPLTNYLFIKQHCTVEIWDVSATGSKMIWEIKPASSAPVTEICLSCDDHRVLVGYDDGSVRMWNLDLENLVINQADATDTRDDANVPQVITISPSGKMVVARSQQSSNVEFLDTTTGKVVTRTDIEYNSGMEIAFSSDEEQVAFLSESLISIWDIMHREKRVSFNPWPRKYVRNWKVAFQTCNDLVIAAVSVGKVLLQVWHRQDPAGFECIYPLDLADGWDIFMAPNGLTVIVSYSSSLTCYSWNHETAQFNPIHLDDQVHIAWMSSPAYSPDGKLFAYRSDKDSHVRVWDTRTGRLVSKFPTSKVYTIALSPDLIDHPLGERLIVLWSRHKNAIRLFDHTGHLHAQILGQAEVYMAFIRDGTALAYFSPRFGLRIWDIADLTADHWHSTHGYELMPQAMVDGWVMGQDDEPLFWVPVERRRHLCMPPFKMVIEGSQISRMLDLSNSRLCKKWTECIDEGWLRGLERKEKEIGNLLRNQGVSCPQSKYLKVFKYVNRRWMSSLFYSSICSLGVSRHVYTSASLKTPTTIVEL